MKKIVLVSSFILSVFVLTACGGGSSNSNPVSSSSQSSNTISSQSSSTISSHSSSAISSQSSNVIPSEFVGVWDASIDEGKDGFDEYYIAIDVSGKVSSYDFAGDTFDDWGNCYWIERDAVQLTSLSGVKYISTEIDSGAWEEIQMAVYGEELIVVSEDVDDFDGDGNTIEDHVETMKKSSRTVQSFTPECVDSFAAARSLIPTKQAKSSSLIQ